MLPYVGNCTLVDLECFFVHVAWCGQPNLPNKVCVYTKYHIYKAHCKSAYCSTLLYYPVTILFNMSDYQQYHNSTIPLPTLFSSFVFQLHLSHA